MTEESPIERTGWLARHKALTSKVFRELHGRLWHCTHPDRFDSILQCGAILPDPPIPDVERWGTSQGLNQYPFVRSLGGVSLFDFDQFDRDVYSRDCPGSAWWEFVPYVREWGSTVWIEIDRERIGAKFRSSADLWAELEATNSHRRKFMPRIEAAHLAPVPVAAFKRAFLVTKDDEQIRPIPLDET